MPRVWLGFEDRRPSVACGTAPRGPLPSSCKGGASAHMGLGDGWRGQKLGEAAGSQWNSFSRSRCPRPVETPAHLSARARAVPSDPSLPWEPSGATRPR